MAILQNIPAQSTERYTWNPEERVFSAWVSDMPDFEPGRIWDDACDVGFRLRSARTGHVVTVALSETHLRDGDLTHWTFTPVDGRDWTVVIYND